MPTAAENQPQPIAILYRNHRGEVAVRRILPHAWRFAESEWHAGRQWLVDAFDVDKKADRTFALADILEWYRPTDMTPKGKARCSCGAIERADCSWPPPSEWAAQVRIPGDAGLTETDEVILASSRPEALAKARTLYQSRAVDVRPLAPAGGGGRCP